MEAVPDVQNTPLVERNQPSYSPADHSLPIPNIVSDLEVYQQTPSVSHRDLHLPTSTGYVSQNAQVQVGRRHHQSIMLPELAAPSLPPSIPSSEPSDVPSSNKWTGKSREGSKHNREKRTICGIELPILILSCAVVILSAALAVTGTLLGLKLSSLEENVQAIMSINSTNRSSQAPPSQNNSENHTNSTNSTTILYTSYTNTSTEYPLPLEYLKVPGWTYLGCYFDSANRVLPEVVLRDNTKMTNKVCGRTCAQEGYNMFGTENKGECWCGNENIDNATKRQRAPDWTCDMMCGGAADGYEPCGGFWTISLWGKNVSS